ncbi:MAG: M24 family metallopeptidase [Promethearchaeota archaeon]
MHVENVQDLLDDSDFDLLYVNNPQNLRYCLGFKLESESHLLVPKRESGSVPVYIVGSLDFEMASDSVGGAPVELVKVQPGQRALDVVKEVIGAVASSGLTVGFEDDHVSVRTFGHLKEKLKEHELAPAGSILTEARVRKTPAEVEAIKQACEITDEMFEHGFEVLEPGMKEVELAAELEYLGRKLGASAPAFETIVASGERSWYPHGTSSGKKVRDGDVVTIDQGVVFGGYCSDVTRTRVVGTPTRERAKIINLVNECQRQVVESVKPGVTGKEVDQVTRDFFEERGVLQYFTHGTGHGVGIDVHEEPYIYRLGERVLDENMVLTIEPGLYVPGVCGARTEDTVVVTRNGARILSKYPILDY